MPNERTPVRLTEARDIRALAHPARMAIVDALASGDELTATECAELTGLSPSATAYHLKFLERYALAEPAPARSDGRERPWRATSARKTFDFEPTTPAGAAATATVALAYFDRTRRVAEAFMASERDEPKQWQSAAVLATSDVWLTADEAHALGRTLTSLLDQYRSRTAANRPDESRRVRVANVVVPHHRQRAG